LTLSATTLFDHPSISSISKHISSELQPDMPNSQENVVNQGISRIIVEETIASIVNETLDGSVVSRTTPLMDAGIDSLAATELVQ
jgi:hypothetical protein